MTNEEVFAVMKEMFDSRNYNKMLRLGNLLKKNNVEIRDLNTKLIVYNGGDRLIIPTTGKGMDRKYMFDKYKIENI